MANKTYEVDVGGKTYEVDAPDPNTAWAWANQYAASPRAAPASPKPSDVPVGPNKPATSIAKWQGMIGRIDNEINGLVASGADDIEIDRLLDQRNSYQKAIETTTPAAEYVKRTGKPVPTMGAGDIAAETLKSIPRGAIQSAGQIGGIAGVFGPGGEQFSKGIERGAEGIVKGLGLTPSEAATINPAGVATTNVGSGFGSIVPYIIAGEVGAPLRAINAARAARVVSTGTQAALGTGQGASEARQRIEAFEKETGETIDPLKRQAVQAGGAAIGLTELLPLPSMLKRSPAGEFAGSVLSRIGGSSLKEGAQEGGTTLAQNVQERLAYDPRQNVLEGVPESAALGAIVGGGVRGIREALGGVEAPLEQGAPGALSTPPLRTVTIGMTPPIETWEIGEDGKEIEPPPVPTSIEILSEPDEGGVQTVRFPDGRVIEVPASEIENRVIPEAVATVAAAPGEPVMAADPVAAAPASGRITPAPITRTTVEIDGEIVRDEQSGEPIEAVAPTIKPEPTVSAFPGITDITDFTEPVLAPVKPSILKPVAPEEPEVAAEPTPAPAPAPIEPITTAEPTPAGALPTLPPGLSRAKPDFEFGPDRFALTFDNDLDKAVYIATSPSKTAAKVKTKYLGWLNSKGISDPVEIEAIGLKIRDDIRNNIRDRIRVGDANPAEPVLAYSAPVSAPVGKIPDAEVSAPTPAMAAPAPAPAGPEPAPAMAAPAMAAPAMAAPAMPAPAMAAPAYSPQEIADNLLVLAPKEARARNRDVPMFTEGVRDVLRDARLTPELLSQQSPYQSSAYLMGVKWAEESRADAQSASNTAAREAETAPDTVAQQQGIAEETGQPLTAEQIKYAKDQEANFPGSKVVYQSGDYGLIRSYGKKSGKAIYIPFSKSYFVNKDIDLINKDPLSLGQDRISELREAKSRMEAEDAAQYAANPSVSHDGNGNSFSEGVPENIRNVIAEWKNLLGLKVKLYVTTEADARNNNPSFSGPYRSVGSEAILTNERGLAQRISDGEYAITYVPENQVTYVLETIAHELGHVHMWNSFGSAPKETQSAIRAEHKKWADTHKATDLFSEFAKGLRARTTARRLKGKADLTLGKTVGIDSYWRSFDEWYADQVSRWAVSDEKPVSVVEKFFSRLGRALRNFYTSLRGKGYLPNETFRKYLIESSANLDMAPSNLGDREPTTSVSQARQQANAGPPTPPTGTPFQQIVMPSAEAAAETAAETAPEAAPEADSVIPYSPVFEVEEVSRVPSLSRRIDRLVSLLKKGRIDQDLFAAFTESAVEDIRQARQERNLVTGARGRARGADYFRQRILQAKRAGDLSKEEADLAEWFIARNPELLDDLGISIRLPGEGRAAGQYNPLSRLVTLFKGNTNDTTIVHEILHHLERMMPESVQAAIRRSWSKAISRERSSKGAQADNNKMFFELVDVANLIGSSQLQRMAAHNAAVELVQNRSVPPEYYQYVNPSEFWTVNASEIVRGKYEVRGSLLGRLRNWLSQLRGRVADLFGLPNNNAIIQALDSLSRADGTFVSSEMLSKMTGTAFSIAQPPKQPPTPPTGTGQAAPGPQVRPQIDIPLGQERRRDMLDRKFANKISRVGYVEKKVEADTGRPIPRSERTTEKAALFEGRTDPRLKNLERDHEDKIIKLMIDEDITENEADLYLLAKATPARNAKIADRDPETTSDTSLTIGTGNKSLLVGKDLDYTNGNPILIAKDPKNYMVGSVISYDSKTGDLSVNVDLAFGNGNSSAWSINSDNGSGISHKKSSSIIDNLLTSGRLPKLQRLGKLIDNLRRENLKTQFEYGLLSQKQADDWLDSEPDYMPLKGVSLGGDMSASGEVSPTTAGKGFSITAKEARVTKGRSTLPFSPLATIMSDAKSIIIRGELNRVRLNFLNNLVRKYSSNAWQLFTDENPDMTRVLNPETGKLMSVPVQMAMFPEQYLVVKENGKAFYIKIKDPLLMRALSNGSAKDYAAINKFLATTIGVATRLLSRLHTTLMPEFFIPNALRDVSSAVFNILAEQDRVDGRIVGQKILASFLKDVGDPRNFQALMKATYNQTAKTPRQREMSALLQQARMDGALTGWIMSETAEEKFSDIAKALEKANAKGGKKAWYSTLDGLKSVVRAVEDFNSIFENTTRLAVYKNALEVLQQSYISSGVAPAEAERMARDEAANMARNVTVDFNRKGELGPIFNSLYAFSNTAVQGNVQLYRSLSQNPFKYGTTRSQKLVGGLIGLGILQAVLGAGMSDDDDDGKSFYDKIPKYEKDRNMIFMSPDGKNYIKIPLPFGYSFLHNLGANGAELVMGIKEAGGVRKKDVGEFAADMFGSLLGNFSPISTGGGSLTGVAINAVPTVLKIGADLAINENFFGGSIYNKPREEGQSLSSVARYSTPEGYKAIAEWLNSVSGGTGKIAGDVNFSAEAIEYLVNQAIGGAGKFAFNLFDLGTKGATGKEIEVKDIPLLRKVLGEPNKFADLGDYYDRVPKVSTAEAQLKDSNFVELKSLQKKYPVETNYAVIAAKKQAESRLREINKRKKLITRQSGDRDETQDEMDRLNELQRKVYIGFNTVYNRVEKEERGR